MQQLPSRSRRLVATTGWLVLLGLSLVQVSADAQPSNITCAAVKACISVDGTNCTKNCPPCITLAPSGIFACVSRVSSACPVTASTACDGVGIFASNATIALTTLGPANSSSATSTHIFNNVSSVTTPTAEASASSSPSITLYLAIGAGVAVLALCIMLFVRHKRESARQSITSPFGHTPNALDTFKPTALSSVVTASTVASQNGPSNAFFGDKSTAHVDDDHDVLGSSPSSVTSFQTASSTGFSHSIFQQQPKHLFNTSSSLSSVSSVFHVVPPPPAHPHAKRVTSTVAEHEVMMDPWDDPTQQRLRDGSVVMMVEGDEDDDLFDKDENTMRDTTVTDDGRLFSECSSRFSDMSDWNDYKI